MTQGWLLDAVLILAIVVMLLYVWRFARAAAMHRSEPAQEAALLKALERLSVLEKRLEQADSILGALQVSMARIEARLDSALNETNASRAAVRRVEDYLLQAKTGKP